MDSQLPKWTDSCNKNEKKIDKFFFCELSFTVSTVPAPPVIEHSHVHPGGSTDTGPKAMLGPSPNVRYPPGVKIPMLARFQDNFYAKYRRFKRPQIVGIVATVSMVCVAFWMIAVQPIISHDFYAEKQRKQWARTSVTREELAHGLPVWRDPFDRDDHKPPSYAK